jgi:hypothetical protein
MTTQQSTRTGQWWIVGVPDNALPFGSYKTRLAAESDRVGLDKFYRHHEKPRYVTSIRKA